MADRLEKHLVKIEQGLGGDGSLPKNYNQVDKLDWHLTKIEDLIEEGGGGGTTVIANPEMSGDEDDLVGLQVGTTKYKVSSGGSETNVVANPEYTGNEVLLNRVSINDVDYKLYNDYSLEIYVGADGQDVLLRKGFGNNFTPGSREWDNFIELFKENDTTSENHRFIIMPIDMTTDNYGALLLCQIEVSKETMEKTGGNEIWHRINIYSLNTECVYNVLTIVYNKTFDEFYIDTTNYFDGEASMTIDSTGESIVEDNVILPDYLTYCPFDYSGNGDWYNETTNLAEFIELVKSTRLGNFSSSENMRELGHITLNVVDTSTGNVKKSYYAPYYCEVIEGDIEDETQWIIHILTSDGDYKFVYDYEEEQE